VFFIWVRKAVEESSSDYDSFLFASYEAVSKRGDKISCGPPTSITVFSAVLGAMATLDLCDLNTVSLLEGLACVLRAAVESILELFSSAIT